MVCTENDRGHVDHDPSRCGYCTRPNVVTALEKMKEYDPEGWRPELCNKLKRKVSLKEGVEFILKQLETKKQNRG